MRMKLYLICPVRRASPELKERLEELRREMQRENYDLYYPPFHAPQGGTEVEICAANFKAIQEADLVLIVWDGKSEGVLFDLGIAYALDKTIVVYEHMIPPRTNEKSFANFIDDIHGTRRTRLLAR